jgi:hypothetical protein
MVVLLHGAAGGWDEVAIAVAAFVVLWVAIKLAGRKPASDEDDDDLEAEADDAESAAEPSPSVARATAEEHTNPIRSSSKLG